MCIEGDLLRGHHRVPVALRGEREVLGRQRDRARGVDRLDEHDTAERVGIAGLSDDDRRSVGDALGLSGDEVLLLDVPGVGEWQGRESRTGNRLRVGAVERSRVRGDGNRALTCG